MTICEECKNYVIARLEHSGIVGREEVNCLMGIEELDVTHCTHFKKRPKVKKC